jgi:uncharacterized protein YhaN
MPIALRVSLRSFVAFAVLGLVAAAGGLAWRAHVEQARVAEAEQAGQLARIEAIEAIHRVEREQDALEAKIAQIERQLAQLDRSGHPPTESEIHEARQRLEQLRRQRQRLEVMMQRRTRYDTQPYCFCL